MYRSFTNRRIVVGTVALTLISLGFDRAAFAAERSRLTLPPSYTVVGDDDAYEPAHLHAELGIMGEVELVRERYADGAIKIERQTTLDGDGNYVNHGTWKMFAPNGDVLAEGQFHFGKRVGPWTRWHSRNDAPIFNEMPFNQFKLPFASHVNFTDGVMDGEWIITDASDRKMSQISLITGQRHGLAITWLPNGNIFRQATYEHGVPVGDLLEVSSKSGKLERVATYVDGRRIITKTDHHSGGRQMKSEVMYLAATTVEQAADDFWSARFAKYGTEGKDLRHGTVKSWYANGKPEMAGIYQHDKKSGTFTFWHPNGQVAVSGEYHDDKPVGQWVWWHENGQKSTIGRYEEGVLIGEWRWWDEAGKLAKKRIYDGTEAVSSQKEPRLDVSQQPTEDDVLAF